MHGYTDFKMAAYETWGFPSAIAMILEVSLPLQQRSFLPAGINICFYK
jgi:hypothetical protein